MEHTESAMKVEACDRVEKASPIRTLLMLAFWALTLPFAAITGIPWSYFKKNVNFLYRTCMWGAWNGVRLAGVRVQAIGLEKIDPARPYIFMSNHVSNLDPPALIPIIPGRCSVLVKKELFRVPVFGTGMRLGELVPVDRGDHEVPSPARSSRWPGADRAPCSSRPARGAGGPGGKHRHA